MSTGDTNITLMARSAIHGTRPVEDIIVHQIPNRCGCTWSCYPWREGYYWVLKFRYAACLARRWGEHK